MAILRARLAPASLCVVILSLLGVGIGWAQDAELPSRAGLHGVLSAIRPSLPSGGAVVGSRPAAGAAYSPRATVHSIASGAAGSWEKLLPGGLTAHAAILDPIGDRMVVFGGHDRFDLATTDTWIMGLGLGGAWSHLAITGTVPGPRSGHGAIYDPVRRRMIVFGGPDHDVWALSLSGAPGWAQVVPGGTPPPALVGAAMIYDPVRDRMLVFGGSDGVAYHNQVWALSFSGTPAWSLLSPTGTPPAARSAATAIFDPVRDRLVVFGGHQGPAFDAGYRNDVWVLSLSGSPAWTQLSPAGAPPAGRDHSAAVYDPVADRMVICGGHSWSTLEVRDRYLSDAWTLPLAGTPAWSQVPAPELAGRAQHSMVFDTARRRAVVFGGESHNCSICTNTSNRYFQDVQALSLTGTPAWSDLSPAVPPWSRLQDHQAVYDGPRKRMLLLGGYAEYGDLPIAPGVNSDVWALSLTGSGGWSHLSPLGPGPSGRIMGTAVYDALRDRVLLFGGDDGVGPRNDVWQLTLSGAPAWRLLSPSGTPPAPREAHVAILDTAGDRMIVFGGANASSLLSDVWALSLGASPRWTRLSPGGTAPGVRYLSSAVHDAVNPRMIVYGGANNSGGLTDIWALSLGGSPAWTPITPSASSLVLPYIPAGVRDELRGRMVLFGGVPASSAVTGSNTTLTLPLGAPPAWSALAPAGTLPQPVQEHSAIYDPAGDRMVIFGGMGDMPGASDNPNYFTDVWALAFSDALVATAASLVSAEAITDGVRLTWHAADGASVLFTVERRLDGTSWTALVTRTPDASDLITFDDRGLEAGTHASYRLAWNETDGRHTTAESEWIVPLAAAPGLGSPYPNPAGTRFSVRFVLETGAAARLELFDISGRRVRSLAVSAPAGVASSAHFDGLGALAPGVYQVRLSQAGRTLTSRVTLTR